MLVRLLRLPEEVRGRYDLSSLQVVVHGAAPCSPEIKRATIDWLGEIEGIEVTLDHLQAKRERALRLAPTRPVALPMPMVRE